MLLKPQLAERESARLPIKQLIILLIFIRWDLAYTTAYTKSRSARQVIGMCEASVPVVSQIAIPPRLTNFGPPDLSAMRRQAHVRALHARHKGPAGPDWLHEIKHDGCRLMVQREGKRVDCSPGAATIGLAVSAV
jgi:hypothetical protein